MSRATPPEVPAEQPREPDGGRSLLGALDEPEVLFDARADPGAGALGAVGAEASVDVPWPLLLRRRVQQRATASPRYQWWVLWALLAGLLSLNITFTVFVVALPTVAHQLHTNISVLTWAVTGPLLAFGLAAPIFGKAGDLFGHRRLYLLGLSGAMVSAVLTALAPNVGILLFARALDGVQGAATGTASMALIMRLFAPEDRVKALGWWSLVGAGGPVLGVTVGSPVIEFIGWRALFWGQLGLLFISAAVVALILPAHGRHAVAEVPGEDPVAANRWKDMDWVGTWSLSAGVTSLMLALSVAPLAGWGSAGTIGALCVSVVAFFVFVWRIRTAEHPLIPPFYFKRRNFSFPIGARMSTAFAYFGAFFLFPLMMEEVYHYRIAQVGLLSAARPLVFALSSPIAGYLTVRVGERVSAVAGAASVTLSMVIFALLGLHASLPLIILALCLSGLGMGVALPATSSAMGNEVGPSDYGVMSAAQLLATQVGEVAGIQVLQTLQESGARRLAGIGHEASALLGTFHRAFWVGALVAAVGVACAIFMRSVPRRAPAVPQP